MKSESVRSTVGESEFPCVNKFYAYFIFYCRFNGGNMFPMPLSPSTIQRDTSPDWLLAESIDEKQLERVSSSQFYFPSFAIEYLILFSLLFSFSHSLNSEKRAFPPCFLFTAHNKRWNTKHIYRVLFTRCDVNVKHRQGPKDKIWIMFFSFDDDDDDGDGDDASSELLLKT